MARSGRVVLAAAVVMCLGVCVAAAEDCETKLTCKDCTSLGDKCSFCESPEDGLAKCRDAKSKLIGQECDSSWCKRKHCFARQCTANNFELLFYVAPGAALFVLLIIGCSICCCCKGWCCRGCCGGSRGGLRVKTYGDGMTRKERRQQAARRQRSEQRREERQEYNDRIRDKYGLSKPLLDDDEY